MHEKEREPRLSEYRQFEVMLELQTAQLVLLQRIYDVQMALLSIEDKEIADEIYETHENGRDYNPPIWISDTGSSGGPSQESQQ